MQLTNAALRVRVYLPDARTGYYRGTRFDWSGVIGGLEYAGHDFCPQWFQRVDPNVHDFTYDGADIVAGPCTAVTGPAEEFVFNGKPLGFEESKAGGTFIKIGVGILSRPDEKAYDPYRLYSIKDGGRWTVKPRGGAVEFRQELGDASSGYGYDYRKTVTLVDDKPELVLDHVLRNTGKRVIQTAVYNHNFMYLDRQAPGPGSSIRVPFTIRTSALPNSPAQVQSNYITFSKKLAGEDRAYIDIKGFGETAADYNIRVEDRGAGAGVRITGDQPLSRLALWAIRAPLSIEPFIEMQVKPGSEFKWRIKYEYYGLGSETRK